jgi:hypothetical protein
MREVIDARCWTRRSHARGHARVRTGHEGDGRRERRGGDGGNADAGAHRYREVSGGKRAGQRQRAGAHARPQHAAEIHLSGAEREKGLGTWRRGTVAVVSVFELVARSARLAVSVEPLSSRLPCVELPLGGVVAASQYT